MSSSRLCLGELLVADVVDGSVTHDGWVDGSVTPDGFVTSEGWVGLTLIRRAEDDDEEDDVADPESDGYITDSDVDGFLTL